jgi:hypothetical protein
MCLCRKFYCIVSGVVFGLAAILHLVRAIHQTPVQYGTMTVPVGASWVGLAVAGVLCVWAFAVLRCWCGDKKSCD